MDQLGLLILLVVMSGGIAYQADKVGKMLGKKRLSFFGLRPRHTAALGTVLVGVTISIFTIAVVMAVSSGVREWVLKGPQVARKLEEALNHLEVLKDEADHTANSNRVLTTKNASISKSLASRQADLIQAQNRLSQLQANINSLRPQIRSLSQQVRARNSQILQLNHSKKQLIAAKDLAETNLKRVQAEEKQAKAKLDTVSADNNLVSVRNLHLTLQNDKLLDAQKALEQEQDRLNGELARIQVETKNLTEARDKTQNELSGSQKNLEEAERQLSSVKTELSSTEELLKSSKIFGTTWQAISNVSRHQAMIYRIGEEVARLSVGTRLSTSAARTELTSLLRKARVEAQKRGAHSTPDFPDAGIFNHTSQTGLTISTEEIERQIVSELAGSQSDKVIIACSSLNAFKGEPVSLEITVLPNPAVYSGGQIVAETPIDGNKGDSVISEEFSKFLQEVVRDRAIHDGMIPIANSDYSFGEVTLTEVWQVVEHIRKADRKVRVQAIAVRNTRAADALKLEFRLR